MSEIALYNALTKLGIEPEEAKEAVANVASSSEVATKADLAEVKADLAKVKADVNALKWMMGLLLAINVAFIVSAVGLMMRFL